MERAANGVVKFWIVVAQHCEAADLQHTHYGGVWKLIPGSQEVGLLTCFGDDVLSNTSKGFYCSDTSPDHSLKIFLEQGFAFLCKRDDLSRGELL